MTIYEEGYTLGKLKEALSQTRLIEISLAGKTQKPKLQKTPAEIMRVLKRLGLQSALTLQN